MTLATRTTSACPSTFEGAIAARVRTAAAAALGGSESDWATGGDALVALVERLRADRSSDLTWLVLTAVAGAYPHAADVAAVRRAAAVGSTPAVTLAVLDRALPIASRHGSAGWRISIVSDVLVDVDACAKSEFHNGIQRVARETVRRWRDAHTLTLGAWTDTAGALRSLSATELARAAYWGSPDTPADDAVPEDFELLVPWHATLVLPEVPLEDRCAPLAALAEHSGSSVVAIGYDAIPVVSADLRPRGEPGAFAAYLTVVKHSVRVAGISSSATTEFAGFTKTLASQGLPPVDVREVMLPSDVPAPPPDERVDAPATPRVLCVGRLEPHKNHSAILHAAERLWQEGLQFELTLVGAPGWSTTVVDRQLRDLRRRGRPIRRPEAVDDEEMWRMIRGSTFSVFVSMHEGFGLPVAESLACGTPVITTNYGSQAEIAAAGGCLTVDPRDDDELTDAMRRMLQEPGLLARLRAEAAARPARSWDDYADEVWGFLVEGEPA